MRFVTALCLLCLAPVLMSDAALAGRDYVSALLMEAETGQILHERDADRTWPPASVAKLMTLLLADEALAEGRVALDDTVTATRRAQKQGGSQVYLGAGEKATLQKLLEAAAVGSANDATVAVAVALYGSVDAAVAAMNARAAALGMNQTHYVNVTGLPEGRGKPDNVSTARDQARLAREIVLNHPGVLEWTKLIYTRFRPGLDLGCTNTLLKSFEGLDGLKTGYHNRARSNLVATAERDGRRFIAVVLGHTSPKGRNALAARLLESGFGEWVSVLAMERGQDFGEEFSVEGGWNATVPVEAVRPLRYLIHPEDAARVQIRLEESAQLAAPLKQGQILGEIQAVLDGEVLSSVPAMAGRRVARAWFALPFGGEEAPRRPVLSSGLGGN